MRSFLPKHFRPNRQEQFAAAPAVEFPRRFGELQVVFQDAVRKNLAAVLQGNAPVAVMDKALDDLLGCRSDTDPLAGYDLAEWQAGKLPDSGYAARLIAEPGRLGAIATPQSAIGAEILLPQVLQSALGDGTFRHGVAEVCREFLSERVLFHPGPAPRPLFSTDVLVLLAASQAEHLQFLSSPARQRMRAATAGFLGPAYRAGPWDQWLIRRVAKAAGWDLPEGLAALPWVAWQEGSPPPDSTDVHDLPAFWPSLLTLQP